MPLPRSTETEEPHRGAGRRTSMKLRLRPTFLIVLLQSAVLFIAFPGTALGCSCMMPDIDMSLHQSNAAFVGEVVDSRSAGGSGPFVDRILTFEVETWVKGDMGKTVEVSTASDSAACGISADPGRVGVFIRVFEGELTGNLCEVVSPDDLIAGGQTHQPGEASTPPLVVADDGSSGDGSANQLARWLFIVLAAAGSGTAALYWARNRRSQSDPGETT